MTDLYDYSEGATPLVPDEIDGLIPTHIVNRGQLNALEQENITAASLWLESGRIKKINTEANLRSLHKKMFGQVWKWAGKFRISGKNIGVDAYQIAVELRNLCEDVDTWIEFSSYPVDEIAVRFHHRLVYIHPFPNGNGRHARMATDFLLKKQLGTNAFSWGSASIDVISHVRRDYIHALRTADNGNYQPLLEFVRT